MTIVREMRAQGASAAEIGAKLGRSKNSVLSAFRRIPDIDRKPAVREFWKPEETMRLIELRSQRKSALQIAVIMDRHASSVRHQMRKLGMPSELPRKDRKSRALPPHLRQHRDVRVPQPPKPLPERRMQPAAIQAANGNGCQFPIWPNGVRPPKPALFCGGPIEGPGSWCANCRQIVYAPQRQEAA